MTPELYYIIIVNMLILVVGYLLGRNHNNTIIYKDSVEDDSDYSNRKNVKSKRKPVSNKIDIDERKVVTKIVTDNLEKKYEDLAESMESEENISSAINKLKNIKT